MINHNIARNFNNDLQKAAAQIKTQFLIVVSEDDRVVTPQPAREFAAKIGVTVLELDEDCVMSTRGARQMLLPMQSALSLINNEKPGARD
jgi:homoserine acetyltransferase